jgi:hypothetical protein
MTLIEGFGDEFTVILFTLILGVVIWLAWLSTYVPDRPLLHLQLSSSNLFNSLFTRVQHLSGDDQRAEASRQLLQRHLVDQQQRLAGEAEIAEEADDQQDVEPVLLTEPSNETRPQNANESNGQTEAPYMEAPEISINTSANVRRRRPDNSQDTDNGADGTILSAIGRNELTSYSNEEPFKVRLKFLNDVQREVEVFPSETIGDLKSHVFYEELSQSNDVRIIFSGRLLRDETATMTQCGISSNCVIHCQIVTPDGDLSTITGPTADASLANPQPAETPDIDLGNLLFLVFAVFLCVLWYLRFSYPRLFTSPTTFTLIAITLLFFLAIYAYFIL